MRIEQMSMQQEHIRAHEHITLFFFYKNLVYKNMKLDFWDILRTFLAQSLNKPLLILRRLSRLLRHFERKRLPDSNSGRTKRLMIVSGPSRDCLMTYESLKDI